ncbi:Uncharacterised protein [Klebsiella pneumoniae]|nr:Uncharacterised protein [Klebsiella pneumoniae]
MLRLHALVNLHLTRRVTFQTERLTLLHIERVLCQQGNQFRGKAGELQHALDVARTVPQLVPDLRRGLALLRQRAETADLLCRVHRHPVVVLDHRSHYCQFVADTLHDDLMPGIDALLAL